VCRLLADKDRHCVFFIRISVIPIPISASAPSPVAPLDLAYGESLRERLDLFLAADPKAPTLAFIHGEIGQRAPARGRET
jgi:hypothetical protein